LDLDPKTWWYVTRATGIVAWALLAASVLWGLFITNKTLVRSTPPAWVLDLHRHLGGLAVVFVGVHVAVLPLDTYTDWGWADLFVPMASRWHPIPIAFGIVGLYLLLAVEITSLLGRRLPRVWWRRIHLLSFPLYVVASIHLFAAGTDTGNVLVQGMVVVISSLIVFLTGVRVLAAAKPRPVSDRIPAAARATPAPRPPAPAAAVPGSAGDLLPGAVASGAPAATDPGGAASGAAGSGAATATLVRAPKPTRMAPPTVDERADRIAAAARAARDRVTTPER
jgi:DMSO/TMAO reductase YedYZ heme-binding membrane subunit